MSETTRCTWRREWRAYRVRCTPTFNRIADEAAFFEDLQDVGGWYRIDTDGKDLIVCVDRSAPEAQRDAFLSALRKQGIEAIVVEEGRGFARRDESLVLQEYRIEIGSWLHERRVGL